LSATQLEQLPLPTDSALWIEGSEQLRAGQLTTAVRTLTAAYGLSEHEQMAVLDWWTIRSKRRKRQGKIAGL
jgi:hypothetical protein